MSSDAHPMTRPQFVVPADAHRDGDTIYVARDGERRRVFNGGHGGTYQAGPPADWSGYDKCGTHGGRGQLVIHNGEYFAFCPDCVEVGDRRLPLVDIVQEWSEPTGTGPMSDGLVSLGVGTVEVLPVVDGAHCHSPLPRHVCIHEHPDGFLIPPRNAQIVGPLLLDDSKAIHLPGITPGQFVAVISIKEPSDV